MKVFVDRLMESIEDLICLNQFRMIKISRLIAAILMTGFYTINAQQRGITTG